MGQATPESMWEEYSQGMDARSHDSWGVINVTTDDKDVVWRKLIPDALVQKIPSENTLQQQLKTTKL